MEILIVEDNQTNMQAAEEASKSFPDHRFGFCYYAHEGLSLMSNYDGVITDLFFPLEDNEELVREYSSYISRVANSPKMDDVVREYYGYANMDHAYTQRDKNLELMRNGTVDNLSDLQFPYGGAIMLRAKALGKRHVLITDLHRHITTMPYTSHAFSVDGMILLLPLIEEGIITIEQARYDGRDSFTYIGMDELGGGLSEQKTEPAPWQKAIEKLLARTG